MKDIAEGRQRILSGTADPSIFELMELTWRKKYEKE
jgi:hypothetical protein